MFLIPKKFYTITKTDKKGRGVFAKQDITAGTIIGDYLGKVVSDDEIDNLEKKYGLYTVGNTKTTSIFPSNLKIEGLHIVNHSCTPNCFMYEIGDHTIYFALRKIFAEEEITVSYLMPPPDLKEEFQYPCYCGSPLCRGAMHVSEDYYDKLNAFYTKEQKKYSNKTTKINQEIQLLSAYPKNIADNYIFPVFANLHQEPITIDDTKLPAKTIIRELIRETGCKIILQKLNLCIFGVLEDVVYLENRK